MKFVPVIVTLAPPARGPLAGLTAATMSSGGVTGSLQPGVATTARRLLANATVPTLTLSARSMKVSWCHLTFALSGAPPFGASALEREVRRQRVAHNETQLTDVG